MRVFQTTHKYPPHIPQFEAKHGITDESNISFDDLRRLIVDDGYASTYILRPALEHKTDEVFYTLWDYERLQLLWAREHNLNTDDLDEIKLAQLEWFKPDVFYNMSPFKDAEFIELVKARNFTFKTICWNGIIAERPRTFPFYDIHLSLHRPYISYWNNLGLNADELQPGIPDDWPLSDLDRPIDVLFYGQYYEGMFSNRNRLIDSLLDLKKDSDFNIKVHLQYKKRKKHILYIPKVGGISFTTYPPRRTVKLTDPPLYGSELYRAINQAKIVVNAYTDYNRDFKSNMRVFEALGQGAFLISEKGNYPEGLEPDIDFYTYSGIAELKEKIAYVLADWPKHKQMAKTASEKVRQNFSKQKQWQRFQDIVNLT